MSKREQKPFNGFVNENFHEWLVKFEIILLCNKIKDEDKAINFASFLDDSALNFYHSLGIEVRQNYAALVSKFKEKYPVKDLTEVYATKLHALQQGSNEGFQEFASKIAELVDKVYKSMSEEHRDALKRRYLLTASIEKIRSGLLAQRKSINSFTEALTAGLEIETLMMLKHGGNRINSLSDDPHHLGNLTQNDVAYVGTHRSDERHPTYCHSCLGTDTGMYALQKGTDHSFHRRHGSSRKEYLLALNEQIVEELNAYYLNDPESYYDSEEDEETPENRALNVFEY